MDWNLLTKGKFYSSGLIYFDNIDKHFKEARKIENSTRVSIFDTNVFLNIDRDDFPTNGHLIIQFDKA